MSERDRKKTVEEYKEDLDQAQITIKLQEKTIKKLTKCLEKKEKEMRNFVGFIQRKYDIKTVDLVRKFGKITKSSSVANKESNPKGKEKAQARLEQMFPSSSSWTTISAMHKSISVQQNLSSSPSAPKDLPKPYDHLEPMITSSKLAIEASSKSTSITNQQDPIAIDSDDDYIPTLKPQAIMAPRRRDINAHHATEVGQSTGSSWKSALPATSSPTVHVTRNAKQEGKLVLDVVSSEISLDLSHEHNLETSLANDDQHAKPADPTSSASFSHNADPLKDLTDSPRHSSDRRPHHGGDWDTVSPTRNRLPTTNLHQPFDSPTKVNSHDTLLNIQRSPLMSFDENIPLLTQPIPSSLYRRKSNKVDKNQLKTNPAAPGAKRHISMDTNSTPPGFWDFTFPSP
ncbi:hypothetical protein DM01DRAFT_1382119 [Hesseltinella vesiculosa]|uniref:Uncharacterized protein n=1 Tax=Hesseltinella vesiculosa TaxID=101127 RepID=A0A1X2GNH0_9FUNG|nr:hypothetical protein DM01DRAFT_1382119 [Hesseltinella vesiculosa]